MDTINVHGCATGHHPPHAKPILAQELDNEGIDAQQYIEMDPREKTACNRKVSMMASEEYLACLFTKQANNKRYGNLKELFVNDGLKGDMTYPKTLEAAILIIKG